MAAPRKGDTRQRLLEAAADLISASPGKDVALRTICDRVGVRLPTLYHHFGSKDGLLEAVIEHGFTVYLARKRATPSTGDPLADLRTGWDVHVEFALDQPAFYTLMYGQVRPGVPTGAQVQALALVGEITGRAAALGALSVRPDLAARHVVAANVGVALALLATPPGERDRALSDAVRDATLAAITSTPGGGGPGVVDRGSSVPEAARRLDQALGGRAPRGSTGELGAAEVALLRQWLRSMAAGPTEPS